MGRPQAPDAGAKGARAISRAQAPAGERTGRGEESGRPKVGTTPAQVEPAPGADRPKKVLAPAAATAELPPASRPQRVLAALRHGRHRRGRARVVLLVGPAAALAVAVLSLVRVAPDSGPGTAEAEPRHPSTLTVEPSAGVSATVVAVPSAAKAAPASAPPAARPTPSSAGSAPSSPGVQASPARTAPPGETPRAAVQQTPAAPEAPEAPAATAPAPAPTPTPTPTASTTTPPPDDEGLCLPVLGVCLKLR
ncbi:hypothetical protein [Streptomyces bauhiniae]|uniref:hypothetical protein n=1 Tax=Streptomyces bauhiniae TaxID=2340725 RepID=UPI00364F3DAB